ncbi:sterol desaturase family protein [Mycolicibacterium mucogenicum]|uniref:Fatty acid hydroxylase n=1 Tax=Mycolicibacterium mucogenicum TaxID=56689 RepID=A0A1A0ML08_MYCMU|nr:sterol desaturase family protein [Mycolicibacterium mucogenicum]OBA86159.1 fatty acid hydroxylase [Mycolicibacterium mucogenicum]TDK91172.1 fatty acid hydroxylase family protein [Mycolicibacterium mucogenicum]
MTITGTRGVTLGQAAREFWRHPTPWMILTLVVGAVAARIAVGGLALRDLWAPLVLALLFPFVEWVIHVFILHWRPRKLGRVTVDTLVARDHRRHHANPREIDLVFIPTPTLPWLIAAIVALPLGIGALVGAPVSATLSFIVVESLILMGYEWTHYLVHTDYKPRHRFYKAVWRNHRLHHFKNEHYWFSVTTSGTSDRVLGTYPDPATVETSPTAKNLHGSLN